MKPTESTTSASTPSPPGKRGWLNRTVLGAALTSGFGDLSHETATAILPGFLAVLGIPAAALGTIEGFADAVASFTKLFAGYIADKLGHRKTLVALGYAMTAAGQGVMALATGWPLILLGRGGGWLGRGIRSPLRDAIMSEAVTPQTRGRAFGFHRAADTVGAVVGPLAGVALLSYAQALYPGDATKPFRFVIWLTVIPGVLSVLAFALLVRDDGTAPNPQKRFIATVRGMPKPFRKYLAAVGVFGLGDFAPSLLILAATQLLTPAYGVLRAAQIAGLLYVLRNIVQVVLSFPIGALADRFGSKRVLVGGYGLAVTTTVAVALCFAFDVRELWVLAGVFVLAGGFVAVEETVESAATAAFVPKESRTIGFGLLGTVNGVGDFVSSTAMGFVWTLVSPIAAFLLSATFMMAGTLAMAASPSPLPDREDAR